MWLPNQVRLNFLAIYNIIVFQKIRFLSPILLKSEKVLVLIYINMLLSIYKDLRKELSSCVPNINLL